MRASPPRQRHAPGAAAAARARPSTAAACGRRRSSARPPWAGVAEAGRGLPARLAAHAAHGRGRVADAVRGGGSLDGHARPRATQNSKGRRLNVCTPPPTGRRDQIPGRVPRQTRSITINTPHTHPPQKHQLLQKKKRQTARSVRAQSVGGAAPALRSLKGVGAQSPFWLMWAAHFFVEPVRMGDTVWFSPQMFVQ